MKTLRRIQEYTKFVVAVVGSTITAATAELGSVPSWVTIAFAALTAVSVFVFPNRIPDAEKATFEVSTD